MPYVDSLQTSVSAVTGRNAPKTGEYYQQIYSGVDSDTGVPVVGVELQTQRSAGPVPLDGLRDAEVLDIVLNNSNVQAPAPTATVEQPGAVPTSTINSTTSGGGGLPLAGIIIFILLMGLIWLVYAIIRIWQNTQAQKAIMRASATGVAPIVESPDVPLPIAVPATAEVTTGTDKLDIQAIEADLQSGSIESWREALALLDTELNNLLTNKGIQGETLSDKLRVVSAGEFASIDIAWEAHQTAKNLLAMHDEQLETQDISRVLKLFKQVFAEHGVI